MKHHLLYTLAITLLQPWALLHLFVRSRKQPEYLQHVGERFGHYPPHDKKQPLIWIHAVSVGETRAAEALIHELREQYPEYQILLSHMTPTGRATQSALLDTCTRCYLPYDTPWGVKRFLQHYQPRLGLIMETELWPNLIAACQARNLPLLLVNARLSEKSAQRYAKFPKLVRHTLRSLRGISAQTAADAERLQALGAEDVAVLGNVKFDLAHRAVPELLTTQWRNAIGARSVFVCASTREGEEDLILAAWHKVDKPDGALLIIVPRHPQRFADVAALAQARGFTTAMRSQGLPDLTTQVWIGDSMGEMAAYYAIADVAFVGGSLLNFGSQNLIEACAVGAPVLLGPSTYNFAQAAQDAIAAGAATRIGSAEELVGTACRLLQDKAARAQMSEAGQAFAENHRGATARAMKMLEPLLSNRL